MTKKPRENRVPIMMSEAELRAIDDWRFENRIATRSDAIRRLCQMGIIFNSELRPMVDRVTDHIVTSITGRRAKLTPPEHQAMFQDMAISFFNAGTMLKKLDPEDADAAMKAITDLYEYYRKAEEVRSPSSDTPSSDR